MKIELAGLIIDIGKQAQFTSDMCRDYIAPDDKDADILIEYDALAVEQELRKYVDAPIDYIENICLYRQICEKILEHGGIFLHSAAIAVDGKGYLFTAKSGTGKTTHINLWLEKFGERAVVVNGDKPILREVDGKFHVYGTPWCGKEGINTNIHVPVEGICILERGKENIIEGVDKVAAFTRLMEQTVRPKNAEKMIIIMDRLEKISENIPIYRLFCNMTPQAAEVAYNGMCKK